MAAVGKLREDLRAMRVDALGHLGEAGNDRGIPGFEKPSGHLAGGMDRQTLRDDQSYAAARALLVVGGKIGGWHAFEAAERGEMRLKHRAVAQRDAGKGQRHEQMRESFGGRGVLHRMSRWLRPVNRGRAPKGALASMAKS